jgi:ABC-type glycerol-3-phosphate transport system substrate-binding protein
LSKRIPLLACALVLSALALAACGGGSSNSDETGTVEEVVETSATSTDPADCAKTETEHFMEQVSQESGKAAVKQCEKEAEEEKGSESVVVSNVEVDGSSATAEAALTGGGLDGQSVEVALVKEGDQWKMNEVVKFIKLDKAKLVENFKEEFSKPSSELSPKFAACFVEAFEKGSQADIEELLISGSSKALEEVAKGCS